MSKGCDFLLRIICRFFNLPDCTLEKTLQTLTLINSLQINCDVTDAGEQTVRWATPNTAHERLDSSITSSSTISHGSIPECVQTEHGLVVTDRGKYQVKINFLL